MIQLWKTILSEEDMEYGVQTVGQTERSGSLFFAVISILLTILNMWKHNWAMSVATASMTLGFLVAAWLAHQNHRPVARTLIALLCTILFTFFALGGQNDGFSILWVILVPVIGPLLVGLHVGSLLSLYFQILLVILFYTPLSAHCAAYYTPTFMMRFPLLYFACYGASTILMCQRQHLYNEIRKQAYHDAMTDLYNRRYYNELYNRLLHAKNPIDITIFSIDINGLKCANDTMGHEVGDELILGAAHLIADAFSEDTCCRIGGDEFVVISIRKDPMPSMALLKESAAHWHGNLNPGLSLSIGYASSTDHPQLPLQDLFTLADKNMYAEKASYYQISGRDRRQVHM